MGKINYPSVAHVGYKISFSPKLMDYCIEAVRNIDSPSVARGLRYFSTQESGYIVTHMGN
jgi:hypothetical protein